MHLTGHSAAFDLVPRSVVASRSIPVPALGPVPVPMVKEDVHSDIRSKIHIRSGYNYHFWWLVNDHLRGRNDNDLGGGHTDSDVYSHFPVSLRSVSH